MALIIRIVDTQTGEETSLSFDNSPIRIGRNRAAEVVFEKPFVSQWHAQVDHQGSNVFITDLGSTNGTTINGLRLQPQAPMQLTSPADVMQIGTLQITANVGEHVAAERQLAAPQSVADRRSLTITIHGDGAGEPKSLTFPSSPVRLGRNKLNEIILEQPFVSQWHALVRFQGTEIVVMDLGSTNGTIVNGQRLQSRTPTALTSTNDVVQIGSITITFGFAAPVTIEAPAHYVGEDAEETALFFDAAKWIKQLRKESESDTTSDVQVGPAMDRVRLLMETFGRSYIELRNGFEQFGKEMGLNVATESTPLHDAQSSEEVLNYLLEWEAGDYRVDELKRAYTDLALHQVALLNGVMAGTRELLNELSPGGTWLGFRAGDIEKKRQELLEEDRFSRIVFGKAFARAYFAVTGGKDGEGK